MAKTDVTVQLSGEDGNVFSILGRTTKALRHAGHQDLAKELSEKIWDCASYDEALQLVQEYVVAQ